MGKVLIIGAGGVGGVVTHKCAQVPEVFDQIGREMAVWMAAHGVASLDAIRGCARGS